MKKFFVYIFIFLVPFLTNIEAQNVTFKCSAPSNVQTGTPFTAQFTLKAPEKGKNFKLPDLPNFNIINQSTSQYSSSSTTIVNGQVSSEQSITLIWNVTLEAKNEGTFTIPAATVTVGGKNYNSNSVTIKVSKGSPAQYNNSVQNVSEDLSSNSGQNLFLNVSSDKTSVYIGEPVYAYCKMYSTFQLALQDFKPSSFDNFWNKSLPMPNNLKAENERVNNKNYITAVLDKRVIFPQKAGSIPIKPYEATFQVYDDWGFPAGSKKVVSNTKIINVKPLPNNKPASFTGAVGDFDINASVDTTIANVDQAITLTLTVSGNGNFSLFDFPELVVPSTFEKLQPEFTENLEASPDGVSGSKTAKIVLIPRVPGKYTLKPIEFSYFDYKTEKYYSLKTDSVNITITGDSASSSNLLPNQKSNPTELDNDIRFIKNEKKLSKTNNFIINRNIFLSFYLIPLLAFVFIVFFMRKKIKENSDLKQLKYKNADKISKQRLKNAHNLLVNNEIDKFYAEISIALWGYISDKFFIPSAELTRQNIVDKLKEKNISEEIYSEFVKILDICETARFAPSNLITDARVVYNKAYDVITIFEKMN